VPVDWIDSVRWMVGADCKSNCAAPSFTAVSWANGSRLTWTKRTLACRTKVKSEVF